MIDSPVAPTRIVKAQRDARVGRAETHGTNARGWRNPARIKTVKTIPIPNIENQRPKADLHYPAAVERAKEAALRLREMGIIDAEGRRIR